MMSSGACFTRWVMATRSGLVDHSVAAGAQGISDAFRDAEMCADALDDALSGRCDFDNAMGDYQSTRDEHVLPMYEFTAQLATLEPPPPDLQRILVAAHGNQAAMDGFVRVNSGVTSPAEFFLRGERPVDL